MLDLLRRNRDLRLLFSAQVVSYLGDWFADVALLGLVLHLTHSPVAAAMVLVSGMLPAFLMSPVAGPAADRFDRRRLIMAVSVSQCGVALTFLLVHHGTVWIAFAARAAIAALGSFVAPASQAAIPNLVDAEDLASANALLGSVWGAMLAVGAAAGGVFTAAFGRGPSFVADAVSFAVAAALIASIRRPTSEARAMSPQGRVRERMHPMRDTVEALRYARGNRDVLLLLCSKTGFGLAGGVVGLLAVYATSVFHAGDAGIGVLLAARGIGALCGPLLARRLTHGGIGSILFACGTAGLVYAGGYVGVALSPGIVVAMVFVLCAHLGGGAQWMLSSYGLQLATPDRLRGRIFAADYALVTLTMSASFLFAGLASSAIGVKWVTAALAGLSAAWGASYLALTRRVRAGYGYSARPAG